MVDWGDVKDFAGDVRDAAADAASAALDTIERGGSRIAHKYLKARYIEITLLIVAGTIVGFIGTPAIPVLGIPKITAPFIGTGLILYAFYFALPSASRLLDGSRMGTNWECEYRETTIMGTDRCRGRNLETRSLDDPPKHADPGYPHTITHDPIAMVPKTTWLDLKTSHFGWLYTKSFLKLVTVSLVALEFSPLSPFPFKHVLIPLVFLFVVYFSMPTSYKKSEPYKAAEGWFRMFLGFVLAFLVMTFLTPNPTATFTAVFWTQFALLLAIIIFFGLSIYYGLSTVVENELIKIVIGLAIFTTLISIFGGVVPAALDMPAVSAFYLMIAFFATTPERREAEKGDETVIIRFETADRISKQLDRFKEEYNIFGNALFVTFALVGGLPIIVGWFKGASLQIAYILVWAFGIMMGITGGRESRPYIGTMVMILTIISFSFAFPTTIGTAVFGTYWAPIEHTGEMFFGPIAEQMDRASCDAYANYQCITAGPIKCQELKLACKRIETEGGTDRSIEITRFTAIPKEISHDIATGKIPDTSVSVIIENTGEFEAEDVKFEVLGKKDDYPNVTIVENVEKMKQIGDTRVESCIGGEQIDDHTCQWEGVFRPGSKGGVNFVIDWGAGKDKIPKGEELNFYYGKYPHVAMRTSFDYHVESTYAVDVLSSAEMTRILLEGEIIEGKISKYTGGPIAASVWTPEYVESGKTTFVSAALTNIKEGTATDAIYCVYVPSEAGTPTELSCGPGCRKVLLNGPDCDPIPDTQVVECDMGKIKSVTTVDPNTMRPRNFKECRFHLVYDTKGAPQKQLAMIGNAKFHYTITHIEKQIPIVG